MTTVEEILEHHGIKGMHWGVRSAAKETQSIQIEGHLPSEAPKTSPTGHAIKYVHEHAAAKAETDRIVKEHGIQAVSNHQLRSANERTSLESQYKTMNPTTVSKGKKFVTDLASETGKQEARKAIAKQLAKSAAKKAAVAAVL